MQKKHLQVLFFEKNILFLYQGNNGFVARLAFEH